VQQSVTVESMTSSTKWRWFRFSLRTLLITMTVLAIWLGLYVKSFRERRAAVAAVDQLEGWLSIKTIVPTWLQSFVSDEKYFWRPVAVRFNPAHPISDDQLRSMTPHMLKFADLTYLNLYRSHVTDAGLANILSFADRLYSLDIRDTAITDDGIAYLQQLPKLIVLRISGSKITTEGVNKIRSSMPNCNVDY
jgi:hypothetical protein